MPPTQKSGAEALHRRNATAGYQDQLTRLGLAQSGLWLVSTLNSNTPAQGRQIEPAAVERLRPLVAVGLFFSVELCIGLLPPTAVSLAVAVALFLRSSCISQSTPI